MTRHSPAAALSGAAALASLFLAGVTGADAAPSITEGAIRRSRSYFKAAMHSISTRAPSARPVAPSALRAGLLVGKKVT